MSSIYCSGYGYKKILCEDAASWFLNKYFPRHKIQVEILHRGLKREGVYGYCDYVGESYRPRNFLIEIGTHFDEELYLKTLFHELTHLKQWVVGSLRQKRGKMFYGKECVEDYDYWHQPHEIEAREYEEVLYLQYLLERNSVPLTKVSHYFHNRLMNAL